MYQKNHQNAEQIIQVIKSNNPLRLKHIITTCPELIDIIARHGLRPIQQATLQGSVSLVEMLIEHGADVTVVRPDGSSLLHLAVLSSNVDLVRLLLRSGCDAQSVDERGETPLFTAVNLNDLKLSRDLLCHNANVLTRDNSGCNVFHLAALGDKTRELIILLCESVTNRQLLEDALFSPSSHGVSAVETAICTQSVVCLQVFLSFVTVERLNSRLDALVEHGVKCCTSKQIIKCLIDAGYNLRRELIKNPHLISSRSQQDTNVALMELLDYIEELRYHVPSLFNLTRLKVVSALRAAEKAKQTSSSMDSLTSSLQLQLPLLLSQKLHFLLN